MSQITAQGPTVQTPASNPHPNEARGNNPKGIVGSIFSMVVGAVPTLIVTGILVSIGIYGQATHWKLPSFAELTGSAAPMAADWCDEHNVPESSCVACNPDQYPSEPDYGWCAEHGVQNCTLHHPDIAQLKQIPPVTTGDLERAAMALAIRERPRNNAACQVYKSLVQFASTDAVEQAGIDIEIVERGRVIEAVDGNGEIRYDATLVADLSSRVPGTAWRVLKRIGDSVQQGEVIAIVDAMEVGRLKSELVKAIVAEDLAQQNVDRLANLSNGIVPGKDILETNAELSRAEAEVLSAEQALANLGFQVDLQSLKSISKPEMVDRLRFLGIPEFLAAEFSSQTATSNLLPIRSPMNGLVVQRTVVPGEFVDTTRSLFQLADPSRMWLMLNVPLEEAELLSLGQSVQFQPNGSTRQVTGKLDWVSTAADRETRMVSVRAELPNLDRRLRDETFGAGRIVLRDEPEAITVPQEAVHWEGCCQIVFVRDRSYFESPTSPKLFHVRTVRTGAVDDGRVEIIAGLFPGEIVVAKGSDVLRAQLLKNSLGAGCCSE